jgi:hypothetical protein
MPIPLQSSSTSSLPPHNNPRCFLFPTRSSVVNTFFILTFIALFAPKTTQSSGGHACGAIQAKMRLSLWPTPGSSLPGPVCLRFFKRGRQGCTCIHLDLQDRRRSPDYITGGEDVAEIQIGEHRQRLQRRLRHADWTDREVLEVTQLSQRLEACLCQEPPLNAKAVTGCPMDTAARSPAPPLTPLLHRDAG